MSKNKNVKLEQGQSNLSPVILSEREGSMDSSAKAFRMRQEGGRSMVEMLGVLAIIGLLSIGGIAGYKNAMNKHAANEIINEVNKRAVSAAGQLLLGKDFNLAEFGNATVKGCTIAKKDGVATGSFGLTVTGMDKGICKQLWDMSKDWSVPVDVMLNSNDTCGETNTFTYLFANDLSKNVAETPINYKTCSDCDIDKCEKCVEGQCVSKCAAGEYCAKGSSTSVYKCVAVANNLTCSEGNTGNCYQGCCDYERGVCASAYRKNDNSEYVCLGDNSLCNKNSDCHTGQFCLVSGKDSSSPSSGRCTPISDVDGYTIPVGANDFFKSFVRSKHKMSWWSANNWCQAQGKHLASLAELGIDRNGASSCYVQGTSSSTCGDLSGLGNGYYSALQTAFGNDSYLWTSDSRDSSLAFLVYLYYGSVSINDRTVTIYALCE